MSILTSPLSRLVELNQKKNLKLQDFFGIANLPKTYFVVSAIIEKKHVLCLRYSPHIHHFPSKELIDGPTAQKALRRLEETTLRNLNEVLLFIKHLESPMIKIMQKWRWLRNSTFRVRSSFHDASNYVISIETDAPTRVMLFEKLYDDVNNHFKDNSIYIIQMNQTEKVYMMQKTLPKGLAKKKCPDWVFRNTSCHVSVRRPSPESMQIRVEDATITVRFHGIGEDCESRLFETLTKENPFCTVVLYSLRECVALFEQEGLEYVQASNEFSLLRLSLERLTEDELKLMKVLTKKNQSFLNDLNLIRLQDQMDYVKPRIVQDNDLVLSSNNDMDIAGDDIGLDQSTQDHSNLSLSFYPSVAQKEEREFLSHFRQKSSQNSEGLKLEKSENLMGMLVVSQRES